MQYVIHIECLIHNEFILNQFQENKTKFQKNEIEFQDDEFINKTLKGICMHIYNEFILNQFQENKIKFQKN